MKIDKLFESLDEKVFTSDLKESLQDAFDKAVAEKSKINEETINEKVETLVEVKAAEMIAERVEEKIQELEEKAEEFQEVLEKEAKEKEADLLDQVDMFLERVVDDFIKESKDSLDESIKSEKADMIIEAMDAMITATGADILKITEAKDESDAGIKLSDMTKKYDELIEENIALEKDKATMMKMGIISEMKVGLSEVDAAKFDIMASLVEFEMSEKYLEKLETIKENLSTSPKKDITESKKVDEAKQAKSKSLNENTNANITTAFDHLI